MARVSDAQRALTTVEDQITVLKGSCRYQEECRALSELLQAACTILQYWQSSSIQDAKVKAAGNLLRFALTKVSRVSEACSTEPRHNDPSTASASLDIPAEATSAAADIQLAVSALATALQWDQVQHSRSRSAGQVSRHASTGGTAAAWGAGSRHCSSGGVSTSSSCGGAGGNNPMSPFAGTAASMFTGVLSGSERGQHSSGGAAERRASNSSNGGAVAARRTSNSSGGGSGVAGRRTSNSSAGVSESGSARRRTSNSNGGSCMSQRQVSNSSSSGGDAPAAQRRASNSSSGAGMLDAAAGRVRSGSSDCVELQNGPAQDRAKTAACSTGLQDAGRVKRGYSSKRAQASGPASKPTSAQPELPAKTTRGAGRQASPTKAAPSAGRPVKARSSGTPAQLLNRNGVQSTPHSAGNSSNGSSSSGGSSGVSAAAALARAASVEATDRLSLHDRLLSGSCQGYEAVVDTVWAVGEAEAAETDTVIDDSESPAAAAAAEVELLAEAESESEAGIGEDSADVDAASDALEADMLCSSGDSSEVDPAETADADPATATAAAATAAAEEDGSAAAALNPFAAHAYGAATRAVLEALLVPGTKWHLAADTGGFVCDGRASNRASGDGESDTEAVAAAVEVANIVCDGRISYDEGCDDNSAAAAAAAAAAAEGALTVNHQSEPATDAAATAVDITAEASAGREVFDRLQALLGQDSSCGDCGVTEPEPPPPPAAAATETGAVVAEGMAHAGHDGGQADSHTGRSSAAGGSGSGGSSSSEQCCDTSLCQRPDSEPQQQMYATSDLEHRASSGAAATAAAVLAEDSSVELCTAEPRSSRSSGFSDGSSRRCSSSRQSNSGNETAYFSCIGSTEGGVNSSALAAAAAADGSEVDSQFSVSYALLQAGNAAYTAGKYAAAAKTYQAAMDVLQDMGIAVGPATAAAAGAAGRSGQADTAAAAAAVEEGEEGLLLWLKSSLNLACCHFRLGHYRQCVAQCDSLLEVEPGNAVALCHRGRALLMMQQHAAAHADLSTALALLQDRHGGETGPAGSASHVAHMELNGSYWQQRIEGLLAGMREQQR